MLEPENVEDNKILSFKGFIEYIMGFCYRHRIAVFIGGPVILLCIWFPIAVSIDPRLLKEFDTADFWGGLLLPFGLSAIIYLCFFRNHSEDRVMIVNEADFGCLCVIIFVPLLYVFYWIYRFVRFVFSKLAIKSKIRLKQSNVDTLEMRVKKLNKLFEAGVIAKPDYDEQLSRLISKC